MSVHLVPHPLIQDALTQLRDVNTETEHFRQIANRISVLLVAEALRDLPTELSVVQTPLEKAEGRRVARDVVVVPVLRAGLGMLEAVLELLPSARVVTSGFSAMSRWPSPLNIREASSQPAVKLCRAGHPMLATGGSAIAALDVLKAAGATNIKIVCIVAAPKALRSSNDRTRTSKSTRRSSTASSTRRIHPARPRRFRRPVVRHVLN